MKTRINIASIKKLETMKKSIVLFALAVILMPLTGWAQSDIFSKYSDNSSVTYVSIKPKMFQMLAKMDINPEDAEAKEFMQMVNSITSFKTLATDDKTIAADVSKWVKSRSNALEELMEVKDNGVVVKFYVKQGKDEDHVAELLMFVNGLEAVMKDSDININGQKRSLETVIVSFTGDINLNHISKLTKKFDLPGSDELEKKK
ncbi:DUF4252 domain-containing protein [Bizionia paragorgiae]|jgi:hypothetical protein|uniref:DUF4252 domain-containing protein n=1 Tax=Bizionia paragorgiae TaxID=283786 RepID=A0A1H3Y9V5_BIZPA|nr:DUF4252 domain-containing protein [Bizionia paragorgiae]MDX1270990.1 DUF4252 domain-containing protein [Bizionia paragorgiae]SEA08330.1 protein of unknown function [Bizionia paragorgiae]